MPSVRRISPCSTSTVTPSASQMLVRGAGVHCMATSQPMIKQLLRVKNPDHIVGEGDHGVA